MTTASSGNAMSKTQAADLRFGLFGLFGSGNFGNDGSLEAMIRHLRKHYPKAQLLTICNGPDEVHSRYAVAAVPIATSPFGYSPSLAGKVVRTVSAKIVDWIRAVRTTRKLDALIMPGTGLLDDFMTGPLGIPLDLFIWSLAARLTGTRIYYVSVGAGPLVNPVNRWLMLTAARMAHWRSYRDQGSKTFMARQGIDTSHDPIFPDIAFKLPAPLAPPEPRPDTSMCIGLGVMTYRGWRAKGQHSEDIYQRYLETLADFAEWIVLGGHRLRLLIGDESDREAVAAFYARLVSRLPAAMARKVEQADSHTLLDVMGDMSATDVVVATRFHNVVCALKMRKPVLSIGYAQKNALLLEAAGLGSYCVEIEDFTSGDLKSRFSKLRAERHVFERQIDGTLDTFARELARQDDVLNGMLDGLRAKRRPLQSAGPVVSEV